MIQQLFGFPLYKTKISLDPTVKKKLVGEIINNYNQNITYVQPRWRCDVFSTYEKFNDNVDYSAVKPLYSEEYKKFSAEMGFYEHTYQITGVWNNVYRKNYFQERHTHNGFKFKGNYVIWFSAVHFLKLNADHPKLTFHNHSDLPNMIEMFPSALQTTDGRYEHSFLNLMCEPHIEEDDFVIFPSTLAHSVGLQKIDDLRITISLNIGLHVKSLQEDETDE